MKECWLSMEPFHGCPLEKQVCAPPLVPPTLCDGGQERREEERMLSKCV